MSEFNSIQVSELPAFFGRGDYKQTDRASDNCLFCMSPLPSSKTRHFSYCSNACKQRAYRQRNNLTRNSEPVQKPTRKSKPKKATVTHIGISGTVHSAPLSTSSPVSDNAAPVIRSFSDLVSYFGG